MVNHSQLEFAPKRFRLALILAASFFLTLGVGTPAAADKGEHGDDGDENGGASEVQWVNHFDLLPGCPEVTTTFNAVTSGIGGGLTGLVIHSSTTGDTCVSGGNKVVHMALELQPGTRIKGVRLCYESTNSRTFITQIRLAQVQNPPATAIVMLDDGTDLTNTGPICVDSAKTSISSSNGSVLLSLRANFGDVADAIVVRALAIFVAD